MNGRELYNRRFRAISTMAALVIAGSLTVGVARAAAPPQQEYKSPFSGRPVPEILDPSASVKCFSDQAAVTGYYREVNPQSAKMEIFLSHSPLKSQTAGGGYQISIRGDEAAVFDEVTKESYKYQVYRRDSSAVILLRGKGVGVEVITIDLESGSFVLADSGVNRLWNRTSVWVGRCYTPL